MKREDYIQMRKTNTLSLPLLYKYYLEKRDLSRFLVPYEVFLQVFPFYFQQCRLEIFSKLDKEFEVTSIIDPETLQVLYMV